MSYCQQKIRISVVVPVLNEERNIERCLNSLSDFDDVHVVDSGSTDDTIKMANKFNVNVVRFNWNGFFPKKRNWALEHLEFKYDWVLFLDADEILTTSVILELRNVPDSSNEGYYLSYTNYFLGKRLRFGIPMKKLALFKKRYRYEMISDSNWTSLDMEIHEHPIIEGKKGRLKNSIEHYDFKSISHYLTKHDKYSSWEAERIKCLNNLNEHFTLRQKLKYLLIRTIFFPDIYFFLQYVLFLGFLDGVRGYHFARLKRIYFYSIYLKLKYNK